MVPFADPVIWCFKLCSCFFIYAPVIIIIAATYIKFQHINGKEGKALKGYAQVYNDKSLHLSGNQPFTLEAYVKPEGYNLRGGK